MEQELHHARGIAKVYDGLAYDYRQAETRNFQSWELCNKECGNLKLLIDKKLGENRDRDHREHPHPNDDW
jgi:hypothetical protein